MWKVIPFNKELAGFPADESHFICQTAIQTAQVFNRKMPPCTLKIKSEIPLARGLGSSAAAIVAGIELANQLCSLRLSQQQKLERAAELEGHPDNAGASLLGGLVIGCQLNGDVDIIKASDPAFDVIAIVPRTELYTENARKVLPDVLPFEQAIHGSSVSNLLVAALLLEDWETAGKMMRNDCFHQPYRTTLVPHFADIEKEALRHGAFGAALSGSGPTIICFVEKSLKETLALGMKKAFPNMDVLQLPIDSNGCQVLKESYV